MNGAVAAVVKLTKRSRKINQAKAITRDCLFKEETLLTYLTEVEAVLNNRPLTSISDVTDLEPLTPNHFLIGRGNPNFRFNTSNEADINIRKQLKSLQATTSMFWKQWVQRIFTFINTTTKMENADSKF